MAQWDGFADQSDAVAEFDTFAFQPIGDGPDLAAEFTKV